MSGEEKGRPRVLLVCYGGSHAATLAPVVKELKLRSQVVPVALAPTIAGATFQRWGLTYKGYSSYCDADTDHDALVLGEQLIGDVEGEAVGVPRPESIAYLGSCMQDLVSEVGAVSAWELYRERGRHAFLPRATLGRIIMREHAQVVVATNSPKSERAAILAGNAAGVPTLMVPDFLADPARERYAPFEAKWYAVMSEAAKNNVVIGHGADASRVIVTGQPAFDKSIVPSELECQTYAAELLGTPIRKPYLLILTSSDEPARPGIPGSSQSQRGVELLLDVLPTRLVVILKPHPSETASSYAWVPERGPGTFVAPSLSDINRLIRGSQAVVAASYTSAVFDALALDRPVLLVELNSVPAPPFEEFGVQVVRTPAAVGVAVQNLLKNLRSGQRLARSSPSFAASNFGAPARVAELIERLATGRPAPTAISGR